MEAEFYSQRGDGPDAIPYRIRRSSSPPDEDGAVLWFMEYLQDPSQDWGPRGTVREIGGKFEYSGTGYSHPAEALEARLKLGP